MKKKQIRTNKLTEFEKAVYAACKLIPKGQTRSYKWIAEKIGRPLACRAVGNALHKNPFAPQVPCHRVIRSDGAIGGFAEGTAKKVKLLRSEAKNK
jgi:methylated-DNA-[protein]-cysteine S-methyltransferase